MILLLQKSVIFYSLSLSKSFVFEQQRTLAEVYVLATWVNIAGIFCYVRLDDLASVSVFAETAQTQTDEHSVSQVSSLPQRLCRSPSPFLLVVFHGRIRYSFVPHPSVFASFIFCFLRRSKSAKHWRAMPYIIDVYSLCETNLISEQPCNLMLGLGTGFSSQWRAKLRTFLLYCFAENTQLSPSLTWKPGRYRTSQKLTNENCKICCYRTVYQSIYIKRSVLYCQCKSKGVAQLLQYLAYVSKTIHISGMDSPS